MADFRAFAGTHQPVLIEVNGGGGGAAGSLPEVIGIITELAAAYGDAVARMPEKRKPSEVKVAFGLRALADGSVAVALDPENVNFTITMTWSEGGGPTAIPAVPAMNPAATG